MSYKSVFLAFFGFLFVCSLFEKDVAAQGAPPGTSTPISAPPPTIIFYTGNSIDTDQSFAPPKNSICWTWNHIIGRIGIFQVPYGKQLIAIKFTENQSLITMNNVVCELAGNSIEPENRVANIINNEPSYYNWTNSIPFYVGEGMRVVTITPSPTITITTTQTNITFPTTTKTETSTTSPTRTLTTTASATLTSTPTQTITPTPTVTNTESPTFTQTATSTETLTPSVTPSLTATLTPSLTATSTSTIEPSQTPVPTRRPRPPVSTRAPDLSPTENIIPTIAPIVIPPVFLNGPTVETLNMATVEAIIATRVSGLSEVKVTSTNTSTSIPTLTMTLLPTQTSNSEVNLNSPEILKNEFGKEINYYKPVKGDICFGKLVNGRKNVIAEFTSNYFRQVKFEDAKCYDGSKISLVQLFVHLASKGESYEIVVFPAMDIYTSPSSTP